MGRQVFFSFWLTGLVPSPLLRGGTLPHSAKTMWLVVLTVIFRGRLLRKRNINVI